jgi:class 3 adenylate cyclase
VPYEAARARVVLADAQLALGDVESAALELRAAHQTFERLGAVPEDPDHALRCAVEIQRTLTEHRRGHGFSPSVRIGLHTCAAIRRGPGYQGKGVHTAARIGAHAQNDEIIASAETLARVETGLPIPERRTVKLNGIAAPVELAAIVWT